MRGVVGIVIWKITGLTNLSNLFRVTKPCNNLNKLLQGLKVVLWSFYRPEICLQYQLRLQA